MQHLKIPTIFILLSLFAGQEACNPMPAPNCLKYHTGEFYIKPSNSPILYYIHRTNNTQIETDALSGRKTLHRIIWLDECRYRLTFEKVLTNGTDTSKLEDKYPSIDFKIIEGNSSFYVYKFLNDDKSLEWTDTLYILNNTKKVKVN